MSETPKFGDLGLSKSPSVTSIFTFAQRKHKITKCDIVKRCNQRFNHKTFIFKKIKRKPPV